MVADVPWLSRELSAPGDLTITTYQSLSSEFRKEKEDADPVTTS